MNENQRLEKQIRDPSLLFGSFKLRFGATSRRCFDKYLPEADPVLLCSIYMEMAKLVLPETEILAGLEMGEIPIFTVLSQLTGLPFAFIRKEVKSYGTRKYAEGSDLSSKRVAIVKDVVSLGDAIIDALAKLKNNGIDPISIRLNR